MKTENCEALIARDQAVIARCQHLSYYPLAIAESKGARLTDADGNQFIDFLSSASSLPLGNGNEIINNAIREQLEHYTQYTMAYIYNEPAIAYAERLTSIFPGGGPAKIAYGNCGSDGNDAAVKFARAFTGRKKIIVFQNGYHGSTYGSAGMSSCTPLMHEHMEPFLPEIYVFPFYGVDRTDEVVKAECVREIREAFQTYLPAREVAAMVIEPIQGDAGILPAHPFFLQELYKLCRENGILFISEEVQQGFWRTGKWFAIENYGIIPDGIIMGKAIGGSLTMGAFMARPEIMDCLPAPAHLFTMAGNAVTCAAGIAAFDYYQTPEFQGILAENIRIVEEELQKLEAAYPDTIAFTRGFGLSRGIGIGKRDASGKMVEDREGTFKILFRSYEKGLLVISVGANILRIQPPLNIKPEELRQGFRIITESIADYRDGKISDEVFRYKAGW